MPPIDMQILEALMTIAPDKIRRGDLYDTPRVVLKTIDAGLDTVLFSPYIQGVVNVDPETWEVKNRERVRQHAGNNGAGAGPQQAVIGAVGDGHIYEILDIFASFNCVAGGANRDCELQISSNALYPNDVRGVAQAQENVNLVTVIPPAQIGFIHMWGGNAVTQDVNGVVTDTAFAESLIPFYVMGGMIIQADITANEDADDQKGIDVMFRRVD